jgi:two-component system, chemotaxis family, sensor kinase CheA
MNEAEFLKRLNEAFAVEAEEHFTAIRGGLADLEQSGGGDPAGVVELMFREAHSLKGAARAVNRSDIESVCQQMESLFARWRKDVRQVQSAPFALCSDVCDVLGNMIDARREGAVSASVLNPLLDALKLAVQQAEAGGPGAEHRISLAPPEVSLHDESFGLAPGNGTVASTTGLPVPERSNGTHKNTTQQDAPAPVSAAPSRSIAASTAAVPVTHKALKDSVRVSVQELDALYRQAEELSTIKFMLGRTTGDLRLVIDQCREWMGEHHRMQGRISDRTAANDTQEASVTSQAKELRNFVSWTMRQIDAIEATVSKSIENGQGSMYIMDAMTEALLEQTRQLLLLPFSLITDALPPMVNKLARDLGKKVEFRITGDDVRIDKRILEELKDPLLHLLRNSIDHGIEEAAQRGAAGKPATGSLRLDISNAGDNRIALTLTDDGAGIDIEAVRARARAEGFAGGEVLDALSAERVLDFVFHSGLSTANMVTELSGRGVGLAVVRENVSALGGEVSVSTQPGRGTTFRMLLPVSMSNAQGVIVRTSGRMYVVPLQYIIRGVSLTREEFSVLDGRTVIDFEGATVPVYRLEEVLGMPASTPATVAREALLVLSCNDTVFALRVEEVLWEQDVVVKPLPEPIARVRTIAGATLLGTGELVPVLHIPDILDATKAGERQLQHRSIATEAEEKRRLLVVDDSITSRVLLHDILVSSGYQVKTAVDGIDALTHLREASYDLVVSDVEMPRMNGFELTQTIRKDEKLHELPVVLVTGLESREDRERGFDVGANAYIIKSGFDQSNLLEVIGRLI